MRYHFIDLNSNIIIFISYSRWYASINCCRNECCDESFINLKIDFILRLFSRKFFKNNWVKWCLSFSWMWCIWISSSFFWIRSWERKKLWINVKHLLFINVNVFINSECDSFHASVNSSLIDCVMTFFTNKYFIRLNDVALFANDLKSLNVINLTTNVKRKHSTCVWIFRSKHWSSLLFQIREHYRRNEDRSARWVNWEDFRIYSSWVFDFAFFSFFSEMRLWIERMKATKSQNRNRSRRRLAIFSSCDCDSSRQRTVWNCFSRFRYRRHLRNCLFFDFLRQWL